MILVLPIEGMIINYVDLKVTFDTKLIVDLLEELKEKEVVIEFENKETANSAFDLIIFASSILAPKQARTVIYLVMSNRSLKVYMKE